MKSNKNWKFPLLGMVGLVGVVGIVAVAFIVASLLGVDIFGTTHMGSEELEISPEYVSGKLVTDYSDIQYALDGTLGGYLTFGMVSDSDRRYAVEVGPNGQVSWAYEFYSNRELEIPSDVRKLDSGNFLVVIEQNGFYEITAEGRVIWYLLESGTSLQAVPLENGNLLTLDVPARAREVTEDGWIV